ncbi:hypothetical protein TorRG33x02_006960 [Trema orientale]|uniref:Uncharacterized protein n=1 Tax=Trema orientale TaxID=63057 RepID=A0A2P5G0D7_TREOI|nr:hypothetical protein TorRG33x02_006960 [Trema orientale]
MDPKIFRIQVNTNTYRLNRVGRSELFAQTMKGRNSKAGAKIDPEKTQMKMKILGEPNSCNNGHRRFDVDGDRRAMILGPLRFGLWGVFRLRLLYSQFCQNPNKPDTFFFFKYLEKKCLQTVSFSKGLRPALSLSFYYYYNFFFFVFFLKGHVARMGMLSTDPGPSSLP